MKAINFNELALENFHQWPPILKYFSLILFAISLLGLNYWLVLSTTISQYKVLINEEIRLKIEFESKQQLSNLDAYKNQLHRIEKIYEKNLNYLVKEKEVSKVLNKLSQAGIASAIRFELFAPKVEKKQSRKELVITIKLIGKYANLLLFLDKLSNFNQLTFKNFAVSKGKKDELKMKMVSSIQLDSF